MRKAPFAIALILAGAAGAAFLFAARSSPVAGPAVVAPIPVAARPATRGEVPVYLDGLGVVQAYNSVTVRAQIDGQITEIAFTEGQQVKAGDILVRIDPRSYQATLDQAVAKRAQDQAQLDNARRDFQRYAALLKQDSIARQQVDATRAQVAQLEAIVTGDEASIDLAKVNLGYATIRSPIDGRVGLRRVDSGNVVHANETAGIVTVTQTRPISILFTLPEDSLQNIIKAMAAGPLAVAALSRNGEEQFDLGSLAMIDNAIDQTTGMVRLKATLPNEAGMLWPGQFVTARLRMKQLRDVLTIPTAAIQNGPDGSFAFRVKGDNTVEVRKLALGPGNAETTVVEHGVEEGDRVVTSGQYRLQPGVRVEVAGGPPVRPAVAAKQN